MVGTPGDCSYTVRLRSLYGTPRQGSGSEVRFSTQQKFCVISFVLLTGAIDQKSGENEAVEHGSHSPPASSATRNPALLTVPDRRAAASASLEALSAQLRTFALEGREARRQLLQQRMPTVSSECQK